jgi:N,N'-diacetyllegionaminate synthase
MKTYIIAEAGVNHNGKLDLAFKLVDAAKNAGVDCIKFQTFKTSNFVLKTAKMADYQQKNIINHTSQFEMLKELELSYSSFKKIHDYCNIVGIDFMSTAFDFDSIDFLSELNMAYWKIPSGEITNLPYLEKIAKLNKPIILSTGMSTLEEVKDAINALRKFCLKEIVLLHCTTEYPTPFSEVNLNAMLTLKDQFDVKIGYSDHTNGTVISIAAVALGASVIEKHFTLDKNMKGPDHKASLEPFELNEMVKNIRIVEDSLGDGKKIPTKSEGNNLLIARKSIVASKQIMKGEFFSPDNLTTKRPGIGINPMKWYEIIGKKALKDYKVDDLIEL